MFALPLILGLHIYAHQADALANLSYGLFGPDGPRLEDTWSVRTAHGWFEVPVAGVVVTTPDYLTSILTDINMTHASVRLWAPPTLGRAPSAVTVAVEKRPWDLNATNEYQWPRAIYDAFRDLYHQPYPTDIEDAAYVLQYVLNAKYLFYAMLGPGVLPLTCPLTATNQLFLAVVNTIDGIQIEAVTDVDPSTNSVTSIQRQGNLTQWTQMSMSSWSGNCMEAWLRG